MATLTLRRAKPAQAIGSVAATVAVLAGILGLSVESASRDQERLVEDFTTKTRQQVHASVEMLSARLDSLDQDTRMLSDLVEDSDARQTPPPVATERRVWQSAFRALAVVVAQYRALALVNEDGTLDVLATDPTETTSTVGALIAPTRELAREVVSRGTKALGKPARLGSRSFLLYGAPVKGRRAIVVASDAALFLRAVAWTPLPAARLFVTDPAGIIWADCETAKGCRATAPNAVEQELAVGGVPPPRPGGRGTTVVQSSRAPAVQVSERLERPTGTWVVTWLASTEPIVTRQRSVVARVVLTALAAAIAVATVGIMFLRQQRKALELEGRLRYAQSLASARETSQSIVENAPLGVLGISADNRVALANSYLRARIGPVRLGVPLDQAFASTEPDGLPELAALLVTELAGLERDAQEIRSVSTGSHRFHVRIVPVNNPDLGVRAFALIEDQAGLRDLEHQLVRAEKLITVGVLSAGIAHEIGSPLAVIRGRAEQVTRALGDHPRGEDLRVIIKHIDHISSTIRQILDFSRRQAIERRPVSLDAIVERTRALLQWKLDGKELSLEVDIPPDLPPLSADPDQVQQVLVNLLLNACDASSQGGHLNVRGRAAREGREAIIEVTDQGCGISPEHMNTVFDPFFTTKKRGEGTGLGLSIVASVVRNHGGRINLDSAPGRGTTAIVRWPTAAAVARRAAAPLDGDATSADRNQVSPGPDSKDSARG